MDVLQDIKIFGHLGDIQRMTCIKHAIFTKVGKLGVTYAFSKEPVPYDKRGDNQRAIRKGGEWGGLFDCAWFHITGEIPADVKDKPLAVIVDLAAEGLIVGENNDALQGISNPFGIGNLADFLNLTAGKTLYHLDDACRDKVDLWIDAGFNGTFGKDIGKGKLKRAELAVYNKEIADLYFDYLALAFAKIVYKGEMRRKAFVALNKAYIKFLQKDIAGARKILREVLDTPSDSDLTVTAVGHSHLDLGWLWPIRETKRKAARTLSTALKNMKLYPDYIYGASQPQQFEWIKEGYPELYKRVIAAHKKGQFEPQGGMWCECDTNLAGGEALIRQFLYGLEFWKTEFGADVKNCWLPDVFGYSAALPQIIKKCGMKFFMTQKLSWSEHNKFPYETFIWEGLSDDSVLVHMPPANTYCSTGAAPSLDELYRNHKSKDKTDEALMLFGAGDGGGGPCEANIELIRRVENLKGFPKVKFGRAEDFFDSIDKKRGDLPHYKGELYLEKHQGTLTTQSDTKKYNRKCEMALHDLEALAAYARERGYNYPREKIEEIWKEVLLYQFHDILPGSSITRIYTECVARYRDMLEDISEERGRIFDFLKKEKGLSVFNSAPFHRKENFKYDGKWYSFEADPYEVVPIKPLGKSPNCLSAGENYIENDLLKLTFGESGEIVSLIDKRTKTEFNGKYLNRLTVYTDKKLFYNAWDIDIDYPNKPASKFRLVSAKCFVDGGAAIMEADYAYGKSKLFQKVILAAGKPYAEFDTRVDWHETHKMLRADFVPAFYSDGATCDIQFGNIKRSTRTDNKIDWAQFEVAAHKYVDVSDGRHGSAVMSTAKYGYRVKDGLISLNLLRSTVYPDKTADRGRHHFRYAYYPHTGDCFEAEVPKWAYLLNYAPLAINGVFEMASLAQSDKRNVIIETVKPAENGKDIIIRVYENEGKKTTATLTFKLPYGRIAEADMLENEIGDCGETLEFSPYEIKTLLLKR